MDINVCRMQHDRLVHYIIRLWGKFHGTSLNSASHFECFFNMDWISQLTRHITKQTFLIHTFALLEWIKWNWMYDIVFCDGRISNLISFKYQTYRNIPIFGRIISIQFPILARSIRSPTIYQEGHTYIYIVINKSLNAVNLVNVTI